MDPTGGSVSGHGSPGEPAHRGTGRWVAIASTRNGWMWPRRVGAHRLARTLEVAAPHRSYAFVVAPERAAGCRAGFRRGWSCCSVPAKNSIERIDEPGRKPCSGEGFWTRWTRLLAAGYRDPTDPGMTGTGYREAAAVLLGGAFSRRRRVFGFSERHSRAYARRQLTWFRHQLPPDVLRVNCPRAAGPAGGVRVPVVGAGDRGLRDGVGFARSLGRRQPVRSRPIRPGHQRYAEGNGHAEAGEVP
jgi:hypothetical protein